MIIDSREIRHLPFEDQLAARRRIYVDGREVTGVWYVDTDPKTGFVRSWDVMGNGRMYSVAKLRELGKMQDDWDAIDDLIPGAPDVASKTIMGRIELRAYDSRERK